MRKVHEHDHEPEPGLPERLPQGEKAIWRGRPSASRIAVEVGKVRWVAGYFLALVGWAVWAGMADGRSAAAIAFSAGVLGILAAIVIFLIELYAWAVSRTTLYTITNRRVVMRVGVGSTVAFNLPFARLASADLMTRADGTGTIAFGLEGEARVSLFHLWPHVRPRRWSRPQPALRCIANAAEVAALLVEQMKAAEAGRGAEAEQPLRVRRQRQPAAPAASEAAHA